MAPSKTYNLAGLHCGLPLSKIRNSGELGKPFRPVSSQRQHLRHTAALAAFRSGQEWLDQVLHYLKGNRDYLAQYIKEQFHPYK
jgi:cystathionine beta-lyase